LLVSSPTGAAAGPVWQPVGDWSIKQGEHCVAELRFAHKSAELAFAIEPDPTKPFSLAYLIIEGDDDFGWTRADIAVGKKWKTGQRVEIAPSTQPNHMLYRWSLGDEGLDEIEAAGRIQFRSEGLRLDLSLPALAPARAQLRACDSAILSRWGFAPEQQARVARYPTVEKLEIKDSDYPIAAQKRGSIGDVNGYLMIGADGRASDCHVLNSSGWPALDSQTCQLMLQRAHYKPALDKTGQPMAAPYRFEFVWH
jgi:TonB family protein